MTTPDPGSRTPVGNGKPFFAGSRIAALSFLVGLVMSVTAVGVLIRVRTEISDSFMNLRETRDFETSANQVLAAVLDAESGYRGYIISGEPRALDRYDRARALLDERSAFLRAMAAEEEAFAPDIGRYLDASREIIAALQAAIPDRTAAPPVRSRATQQMFAITERIDALRAENAAFQARLQAQLLERRETMTAIITQLLGTVAILLIGVVLAAWAQAREFVGQVSAAMSSRRETEREIASLSSDLSDSRVQLEVAHRRLEAGLRAARVAVFSIDHEGAIHWTSDPAHALFDGNDQPMALDQLMQGAGTDLVRASLDAVFHRHEMSEFEFEVPNPDGSTRWFRMTIVPKPGMDGIRALGAAVDITLLKRRDEANRLLMRELSHRSKNLLAIVQAMARQTGRSAAGLPDFRRRFEARLSALAASHDLLVANAYSGANLRDLLISQLGPLADHAGTRIAMSGPETRLRPEAAQNIGMALHELATNAQLHGALADDSGTVSIDWRIEDGNLVLSWRESRESRAGTPGPPGFGTLLIASNLPRSLHGSVTLEHLPEGTLCRMVLPLDYVAERSTAPA